MTPAEYTAKVLSTESSDMAAIIHRLSNPDTVRLLHAAIGMATEAGEILDQIKKHIFYGKELDKVNIMEECGDALWYTTVGLDAVGFDLDTAMEVNIKKLEARYPSGKFSADDAINRDTDAERKVLEDA